MTQAYNLSQLANFVNTSGQLDATLGLVNTSAFAFPSGTRMPFNQTAAPTGWTKQLTTAINDSILRLVTGSVSSGGSTAFSTFNAGATTGATTLTIDQIPSHTHNVTAVNTVSTTAGNIIRGVNTGTSFSVTSTATGGGNSHTHSLTANIKYYDFIIAEKD
jgi:hypothetical protein